MKIRKEEGMTLIEVLVVVTILAVVMGAIAQAMMVTIQNQQATSDRMVLSRDAQIASAYFVSDAANGEVVTLDGAATPPWARSTDQSGLGNCGTQPTGYAQSNALVHFEWQDALDGSVIPAVGTAGALGTPVLQKIAFYFVEDSGSEKRIVRRYCELDDDGTPITMVAAGGAATAVRCNGTSGNEAILSTKCAHDTIIVRNVTGAAPLPTVNSTTGAVTMNVSVCVQDTRSEAAPGACSDPYDFQLQGTRRSD